MEFQLTSNGWPHHVAITSRPSQAVAVGEAEAPRMLWPCTSGSIGRLAHGAMVPCTKIKTMLVAVGSHMILGLPHSSHGHVWLGLFKSQEKMPANWRDLAFFGGWGETCKSAGTARTP